MYLYGKSLAMDLLALGKKKFSLFSMKVFYAIKHFFFSKTLCNQVVLKNGLHCTTVCRLPDLV